MQEHFSDVPLPSLESLPEVLDAQDLSAYFKLPCSTIRTLAKDGRIPSLKIGRRRKFLREAIRQWLTAQTEQAGPSINAPMPPPPLHMPSRPRKASPAEEPLKQRKH